jgi:hypothetical protein
VWALSLQGVGQLDRALAVLEAARAQHPRNRDLLVALATRLVDFRQLFE